MLVVFVVFVGAFATALTDLWAMLRHRMFGVAVPDWARVGRWLVHAIRGCPRPQGSAHAVPVRGERALGWCAHYAIGLGFGAIFMAIVGHEWLRHPTLWPALVFGCATVAAAFLVLQPGLGLGIAASRARHPNAVRVQSLLTHGVFGLGLYLAGELVGVVCPLP